VPRVLGVDSSTQATKIELRDADTGVLLANGRASHPSTSPPCSEQHPSAWWEAFDHACARAEVRWTDVDAISFAAQQHGMVVLDDRDEVIRPAKLWNDTESAADAKWLLSKRSAQEWADACGSVPLAAFTITKLSWLHRTEPESWARVARVCLPHDWLTLRLTGEHVTDRGDASGTGYWSPRDNEWALDLLAIVDAERDWMPALPKVCDPYDALPSRGSARTIVAPGTGDNMAAALAVGAATGRVVVSIGTSGTVFTSTAAPTADASGSVAGFADATGRFLPLVCTANATKVTDAVARWCAVDLATLDAMALATPAGAGGVALVPYLDGERTPNRPDASGTIVGLRSDTAPAQLARAAFEGVACGLLDGLDALLACGVTPPTEIALIGGGAMSRAYRQVVADLAQAPVVVPAGVEHVACGAAVQAAAVLQGTDAATVAAAWSLDQGTVTEPSIDADHAAAVRNYYAQAAAQCVVFV
jgi:xylulokinase